MKPRARAAIAAAALAVLLLLLTQTWPRCDALSPHGPRLGNVLIGGCA